MWFQLGILAALLLAPFLITVLVTRERFRGIGGADRRYLLGVDVRYFLPFPALAFNTVTALILRAIAAYQPAHDLEGFDLAPNPDASRNATLLGWAFWIASLAVAVGVDVWIAYRIRDARTSES